MVYEDALVEQPRYSITLSTRSPIWDADAYRRSKENVLRALRRQFERVEMLEFIEQTTGKAPRSGGHRRGHGHNLVKGIDAGHVLDLEAIVVPIWKRGTGAWQVVVSELASAGGAVAYLTLNLALEKGKAVQAPTDLPKGTRTLRATRGYWSLPVRDLRERAVEHHARRRLEHQLLVEAVESIEGRLPPLWLIRDEWVGPRLEAALEAQQRRSWTLWEVREPAPGSLVFEPVAPSERSPRSSDVGPGPAVPERPPRRLSTGHPSGPGAGASAEAGTPASARVGHRSPSPQWLSNYAVLGDDGRPRERT
jgi:hypothetical protein